MTLINFQPTAAVAFVCMSFLIAGSAVADTIWEAKKSCKSDFGFFSGCEAFSTKIPVGEINAHGLQLPVSRRLFFSLSCSRYTGRAPLVTLRGQSFDVNLGFAKSSSLQIIDFSSSSESTTDFSISFDRISQFAPDCKVQYFGSVISPNIQFVESSFDAMASDIDDRLEIKRSLLEVGNSQPDVARLNRVADDLGSAVKRQNMSCMRLLQQSNRRTIKPVSDRGESDASIIELALGAEFSNYEGALDAKSICEGRNLGVQSMTVAGMVARFVNEATAIEELKKRLADLSSVCNSASCSGDIAGMIDASTNNRLKKLKEFIDVVENYSNELKIQVEEVDQAIKDSALSSWSDLRKEMMAEHALMQTIVQEGRKR